jgi:hypothetical protein
MGCIRVAAASSDGEAIDQPLAEATRLHIFDVYPDRADWIAVRELCEEAPGGAVESLLNCLDDCSLLLVREISGSTGGKLRIGWITVWEAPMPAEKALGKLRNSPMFRRALGIGLRG